MRWNELYNRCEPNERRILNRALFSRIIIDEDEDVSFKHRQPVKSVLNQPTSHDPSNPEAETKTPRHQTGQVSIFSTYVDLAGGMSKLSPALNRMAEEHTNIRQRPVRPRMRVHFPAPLPEVSEEMLDYAATTYSNGATIKSVAKEVGIGHERLARLLRERGVRLRLQSATTEIIAEMCRRYTSGESLARIGEVLGFSPSTVRNNLVAIGVVMRDSHGRPR